MFDAAKYSVGWISALPVESVAALALLDEEHDEIPDVAQHDNNSYCLGSIGHHNVVIAVLPDGEYGTTSAASVASNMLHSFPNVRIGMMVGIAGGAPTNERDIRLGDVVVSSRDGGTGGVFQYDYGKVLQNQDKPFEHTGFLDQPPPVLRAAVAALKARYKIKGHRLNDTVQGALQKWPRLEDEYSRPPVSSDRYYKASFIHPDGMRGCEEVCGNDLSGLAKRAQNRKDKDEPAIHYGLVGSGNSLMKDAVVRDKLAKETGVLCFEMEAAGLMNHFPCLIIRGICDYSDSHKSKQWQGYASMIAAAYAKDVLSMIPRSRVEHEQRIAEALTEVKVDKISDQGRAWQTNVSGGTNHLYQGDHTTVNHNYGQVSIQQAIQDESQIPQSVNALKTDINYVLQKNRNNICAPGTGEWFFHHPEYEGFQKAKGSQLLFVTAEAGGGKSTTMRTLVDRLQVSQDVPLVAFFFFKDDDDRLRSYDEALSTLTYQLLVQDRDLVKFVKGPYQQYGDALRRQTKTMWQIIVKMAQEAGRGIICVLDAVDECATLDRKQLIADLAEVFSSHALLSSRLKFVVTSRPYEDENHPYDKLVASSNIRTLAGENAQVVSDIRKVIRHKAEELAEKRQLSPDIRDMLIARLSEQNLRTRSFLAVRIAFELLDSHHMMHKGAGKRTLEIILASIPQQLSDLFDEMLERSRDKEHTWKLFCVILASRRTLKVSEFKVIYALTQSTSGTVDPAQSYDELELPTDDEEFKRFIRSRCGLFITFIRDSVHLFHQTAREHLMNRMDVAESRIYAGHAQSRENDGNRFDSRQRQSWKGRISLADANVVCLRVCLDILTFTVSQDWVLGVFDSLNAGNGFFEDIRELSAERPLLLYAAYNWHEHFILGGTGALTTLSSMRYKAILDVSKHPFWVWFLSLSNYICTNTSQPKATISSVWEAAAKARRLKPEYGPFLREDCLRGLFPLDEEVHFLLGDRETSPKPPKPGHPSWQATGGYDLLDKFHYAFGEYEFTTPSQAVRALERGEEQSALRLSGAISVSTLIWTCITDDAPEALRKVLTSVDNLEWLQSVPGHIMYRRKKHEGWSSTTGKDLRTERRKGWTSPWPPASVELYNAGTRLTSESQALFEVLANWTEASTSPSSNAQQLWDAGGFLSSSLCCRLVKAGALLDRELWKDHRTALHIAATLWEHDLIRLLIELGADPAVRSPNGYNALHWFLRPERAFTGEDPNRVTSARRRRDTQIGKPRHEKSRIAASVKALVRPVANQGSIVNVTCGHGATPLMLAARYSPTATRSLLVLASDPERRDEKGRTALMHFFLGAFKGRSIRILKYLLDAGADSQAADLHKTTVLGYWAHRVLRQKLASLYAGSNSYNKAFHLMASVGPLSQREVLIQELKSLEIPLVVAARLGNAELCWALLASGAHPDKHGVPKNSSIGRNSGSEASDLEDLAWNPLMVALHAKAYVTSAVLLAYGADAGFQVPARKRTKYNKYRLLNGQLTPLHIAVGVDGRDGWYSHIPNISLTSSERHTCAFNAATHPDHPVTAISGMEMRSKRQKADYAKFRAREYDVPSSDSEYEIQRFVFSNDSTNASKTPFDTLFGSPLTPEDPLNPLLAVATGEDCTSSERREAIVEYMLEHGAPVNAKTQAGITPLLAAVGRGRLDLTKILLKHGADPNLAADGGCTPLIVAAWDGHRDLIDALIESGANPDAQLDSVQPDKCNCVQFVDWTHYTFDNCYAPLTALVVAAKRGHYGVVEALLAHGADPNHPIEHHAHGRLLTRRERRLAGRLNTPESSDTDPEPDPQRWDGCFSIGTALTWARGKVRDLLLLHGADDTVERAPRRCDCPVIEEKEVKSKWMGGSDDEYPTSEESGSDTDLPWRRRRRNRILTPQDSSSESS